MKKISEKLNDAAIAVSAAISEYIPESDCTYSSVIEAIRYSSCDGGKRIRPFLTLEFAKLFGGKSENAMPYACAIEMIHTYSLIHDDLPCMDNDDYRRGRLSCHKKFGEATALLAGDALLTKAFGVAASNPDTSLQANIDAVNILSETAGYNGMIGGQEIDLLGENQKLSEDDFLMMNRMKTGCLIKAACLLGAIASGHFTGSKEYSDAEKYAENIGLAFQIEDDILDMGTEDTKTTFLSFMSQEEAVKKIKELTETAIDTISKYNNSGTLTELAVYLSTRTN